MSAGDVLLVDLDDDARPFLVLSDSRLRYAVLGVPLTRDDHGWPTHARLSTPSGPSIAQCDQVQPIRPERVIRQLGRVSPTELATVRRLVVTLIGA
jgi:mRNA-degrading endonuclease toxin of MazEF toxin-antitoxin module